MIAFTRARAVGHEARHRADARHLLDAVREPRGEVIGPRFEVLDHRERLDAGDDANV